MSDTPFTDLDAPARRVTPRNLQGSQLQLWNQFLRRYLAGSFDNVANKALLYWARKHVGLNCSLKCFREALAEARERQELSDSVV